MTFDTPYKNYLTVLSEGKGIPYGAGERQSGSINHGFRSLKNRQADIALISEAQEDHALASILSKINAADTAFFTVGCVSGDESESGGHRVNGYVEIAINDQRMVANAVPYFETFFHFIQKLAQLNFKENAIFNWELIGATFAGICDGMTCRIIVNTGTFESQQEARACWANSLAVLGDHLSEIKDKGFNRIYS